jgi:peptidoglycan/xylan/chitin deacetylase (PgdA/CDA1 family)
VNARERLAGVLHRAGALRAVLELRRVAPIPAPLCILTYHHLSDEDGTYPYDDDVADATPAQFRRQMEMLARYGTPIGIDELIRALDGAPLPKNPVMVTFDDGYRSCHDVVLPILRAVGVRATFFLATDFITNRRLYWWERIALAIKSARITTASLAYPQSMQLDARDPKLPKKLNDTIKNTPGLDVERFVADIFRAFGVDWDAGVERQHADRLVMSWDQVRALVRAGMDVESHTRHHRVLQTLTPEELRDELAGSRAELEGQLGRRVRAIAYPVGRPIHHDPHIRDAVAAAGYQIGMTSVNGVTRMWPSYRRVDRFNLPRLLTDRVMSDAMWMTQLAIPRLAYLGHL